METPRLLIFGLGYSAAAIRQAARTAGYDVVATRRNPKGEPAVVEFEAADAALVSATHVLSSVPPGEQGDPVLQRYGAAIAAAPRLRWIGYLSTTGVYGDHGGAWVDETTEVVPHSDRARRRVAAEEGWAGIASAAAVDIFRLAGIYGPGRSVFDDLRAGRARRIIRPGHAFGRIHRDDIAAAVLAAMQQGRAPGTRILNLSDDVPAESAEVMVEAAALLGVPPPPAIPFEEAVTRMSPMARSFWADHRRVASQKTQQALSLTWRYPSFREGLRAILAQERLEGGAEQSEVGGP